MSKQRPRVPAEIAKLILSGKLEVMDVAASHEDGSVESIALAAGEGRPCAFCEGTMHFCGNREATGLPEYACDSCDFKVTA